MFVYLTERTISVYRHQAPSMPTISKKKNEDLATKAFLRSKSNVEGPKL